MAQNRTAQDQVIARGVTFDDWMKQYAEDHTEWVEGTVTKLSPVTRDHDLLDGFLYHLLRVYLSQTKAARLLRAPFVMRVRPDAPGREPDMHLVLNERAAMIQETMTDGAADIVIEIVSRESQTRDRIDKYDEYEAAGVREYWLIDPLRKQADFYTLGDDHLYRRIELKDGEFQSLVLPHFRLDTEVFWQTNQLEDDAFIRSLVDRMLNG